MTTIDVLFLLIRSVFSKRNISEKNRDLFTEEKLLVLKKMAKAHDLSHLLALGLKQNQLLTPGDSDTEKNILLAVYRYEKLNYELENICGFLETEEIPFMPLKGSVIRAFYPEPWMRTSCDIDILVKPEDASRAAQLLVEKCGYTFDEKGSHDISLFTPGKVHVELHYDLIEEGAAGNASDVLLKVWETSVVRSGYQYLHEMPDEMFYFYHLAHMAKHFEIGGCGIRPFIDLWILDNLENTDYDKRNRLLEKGQLAKFADAAGRLSRVWLNGDEKDSLTERMEEYILRGGVYGSNENKVAVQQQKQGGKFKYALSKIVIPYEIIKFQYPVLQKYRWMTPIMQVRRWCKLVFCGHIKRTYKELRYNHGISSEKADSTRTFLSELGL